MPEENKAIAPEAPKEPENKTETPQTAETKPTNWKEEVVNNKDLKKVVDEMIAKSKDEELRKQRLLADEAKSRDEKLKALQADEKIKFLEEETKRLETKYQREIESDRLRIQTKEMFAANKTPEKFADKIDFMKITAEGIKDIADMYAEYEIYPKGEFEKRLKEARDEQFKQANTETHINNNSSGKKYSTTNFF